MTELRTPLEIALLDEDLAGVNARLEAGDTPHSLNHLGIPALYDALRRNNLTVLDRLDEAGTDWSTPYNLGGFTPLIYASLHCDIKTVRWLVERGQDVCQRTQRGIGVMHVSAQREGEEIARYLYQQGADPFRETDHGETPLLISLKAKKGLSVFTFLLDCYVEASTDLTPLLLPCVARIFDKQQSEGVQSLEALLRCVEVEALPSEKEIRGYLEQPGHFSSSPFRTLDKTLSTRMSHTLFALLKSARISRAFPAGGDSNWRGLGGL